jgi:N utilization substance protein B
MSRRKAREEALKLVFEAGFKPDESVSEILAAYYENSPVDLKEEKEYFEKLVTDVCENRAELDAAIERYAIGWKISRFSRVSLAILRIALCEFLRFPDIPASVSVNEAVELAKKYDTDEAGAFINGILGSYLDENEQL